MEIAFNNAESAQITALVSPSISAYRSNEQGEILQGVAEDPVMKCGKFGWLTCVHHKEKIPMGMTFEEYENTIKPVKFDDKTKPNHAQAVKLVSRRLMGATISDAVGAQVDVEQSFVRRVLHYILEKTELAQLVILRTRKHACISHTIQNLPKEESGQE